MGKYMHPVNAELREDANRFNGQPWSENRIEILANQGPVSVQKGIDA